MHKRVRRGPKVKPGLSEFYVSQEMTLIHISVSSNLQI